MKGARSPAISFVRATAMIVLSAADCRDVVLNNVAVDLRDGTITAATGIIDGFFEQRFGLEGPDGQAQDKEDGDNDLSIHL